MGAITVQNNVHLERLLTTDPTMEQYMRTAVSYVLEQARKDVTNDISGKLKSDPRQAARAVRSSLYKRILGGQVNILRKKRAGSPGSVPPTTRGRLAETERYMGYQGSDRGFILRFLNAGTEERVTKHMNEHPIRRGNISDRPEMYWKAKGKPFKTSTIGSRGAIAGRNFFGPASTSAMNEAAVLLTKEFERIIAEQSK